MWSLTLKEKTQLVSYQQLSSLGGEGNRTYDAASDAEALTEMEGNCVFDEIVEPLAQGTVKAIIPLISRYLSGTVSWLCKQEREKSR